MRVDFDKPILSLATPRAGVIEVVLLPGSLWYYLLDEVNIAVTGYCSEISRDIKNMVDSSSGA